MNPRLLFFALPLLLLCACGANSSSSDNNSEPADDVSTLVAEATLVKISFEKGDAVAIEDTKNLQVASRLISANESPAYKCGYDGSVTWAKGDEALLSAEFNLSEDCRHLSFIYKDELVHRRLSEEGFTFLDQLRGKAPLADVKLTDLSWILGSWVQSEAPGVISYENWDKVSDTRFSGYAYTLRNNDTAFSEILELVQEADGIYYIPTIPSNDGPVRFKMTSGGGSSAVFENPSHDFPQMIAYKSTEDTILHARISGTQLNAAGKEEHGFKDFFMSRVR